MPRIILAVGDTMVNKRELMTALIELIFKCMRLTKENLFTSGKHSKEN